MYKFLTELKRISLLIKLRLIAGQIDVSRSIHLNRKIKELTRKCKIAISNKSTVEMDSEVQEVRNLLNEAKMEEKSE